MHGQAEEMPNESSVVATVAHLLHQASPVPSRPLERESDSGKESLEVGSKFTLKFIITCTCFCTLA